VFDSHDKSFRDGNLQLEVIEYCPALVFPVFKINAMKKRRVFFCRVEKLASTVIVKISRMKMRDD